MDNSNALQVQQQNTDIDIDDDGISSDSIFKQPEFPYKTKRYSFTPSDLQAALTEFAHCTDSLDSILQSRKIETNTFYQIIARYAEINEYYTRTRRMKARKFGERMELLSTTLPTEPEMYVYDREGNRSLSSAAASLIKTRLETANRLAQIHETGSYIPISKQETTNRSISVSFNSKLPANFDPSTISPGDLMMMVKG